MPTIDEIVRGCQRGDPQAFAALFNRYEQRVYDLACVILRNSDEAKDVVQDTFVRVLERINTYRGTAAFESWLLAIAINCCRDRLRRQKVRRYLSLEFLRLGSSRHDPAAMAEANVQRQRLWQAVNQLDDRLRLPFILRYRYEYSCGEIAAMLDIAVTTVYERLSVARRRLRTLADEDAANPGRLSLIKPGHEG